VESSHHYLPQREHEQPPTASSEFLRRVLPDFPIAVILSEVPPRRVDLYSRRTFACVSNRQGLRREFSLSCCCNWVYDHGEGIRLRGLRLSLCDASAFHHCIEDFVPPVKCTVWMLGRRVH
jgi:hypothetical protein